MIYLELDNYRPTTYNSPMSGRTPEEQGLVEVRILGIEKAIEIRDRGIEIARAMGISGFLVIYGRDEMQLTSQAVGKAARPMFVNIALQKIETVLAARKSVSRQNETMQGRRQERHHLGDAIGTLLEGGVAIFSDEDHTDFVGAIAFSGGMAIEEDQEICRLAVEQAGLFTDLGTSEAEPLQVNRSPIPADTELVDFETSGTRRPAQDSAPRN